MGHILKKLGNALPVPSQFDTRWPREKEDALRGRKLLVHRNEKDFTFKQRMTEDSIVYMLRTGVALVIVSLGFLLILLVLPEHFTRSITSLAGICYLSGFITLILGCKRLSALQQEHEQGCAHPRIFSLEPYQGAGGTRDTSCVATLSPNVFMLTYTAWEFSRRQFPDSIVPASYRKTFVEECEERISEKRAPASLCEDCKYSLN
jgi:hypothetical protein